MLFDEPFNHLDLRHQFQVSQLLRSLADAGRTVVAVMHDPYRAVSQCTHALLVYDSCRFEHGPLSVINPLAAKVVSDLYGLERPHGRQIPESR